MFNIDEEIKRINNSIFFSNFGINDINDSSIIFVDSLYKIFIEPKEEYFNNNYTKMDWLPSSPTQDDPYYKKIKNPPELINMKKNINKLILEKTRNIDTSLFKCQQHDFSIVAKNALSFSFRQLVVEEYFCLGNNWRKVVNLYYAGHWPFGYYKDKLFII
ncbi:hypothetical protein G9F32_16500 [Acinetobacter sp. 194]|uniref:hypothetical protein n=1 Tax=Acinetobacter shaoyimingii TaxID=2715164 RepID=UPI00140C318C|nr:hypothetical protein [Acinetobacter shaoyimingii]NHB59593.1 hypothetical protein [Acinetobacter shaoyimingii]